MTESRIDVGGSDIDETFERTPAEIFSDDLIRFLGGEAAQASLLATTINTMPGRNRHNAMLALSSLVLALESAADEPVDLRYLVDEQLSKRRMHVVAERAVEVVVDPVGVRPAEPDIEPQADDSQQRELPPQEFISVPKGEHADDRLPHRPFNYLQGYFDMSLVNKLTVEHIPAMAHVIVGRYYQNHPKKKIPKEQREAEMVAYLMGKSDEDIAEAFASTAPAVQVGRSVIFTDLRKTLIDVNQLLISVLDENEADDALADFAELEGGSYEIIEENGADVDNEVLVHEKSVDITDDLQPTIPQAVDIEPSSTDIEELDETEQEPELEIEQDESVEIAVNGLAEGVVFDRSDDSRSSRVDEILAEHGISDVELVGDELSLRDQVLNEIREIWGNNEPLIASFQAMLSEQQVGPGSASARQELRDLMEKYAPRWMQKLDISKPAWQLTRNVLGFERKPLSIKEADRLYRGRLGIIRATAEDEFLQIAEFLLGKQLAGEPAEPKAHHATPGKKSFHKGRAKK